MLRLSWAGQGACAAANEATAARILPSINISFVLSRLFPASYKIGEDDSHRTVTGLSCRCKVMARFPQPEFGAEYRKFST